jgi:hypothetical protein
MLTTVRTKIFFFAYCENAFIMLLRFFLEKKNMKHKTKKAKKKKTKV